MKVALFQHQPNQFEHWRGFASFYKRHLEVACEQGVELFCLPEYIGLELLSLFEGALKTQLKGLQGLVGDYVGFFQDQANALGMSIQPGSILEASTDGRYRNRAYFFVPQCSEVLFQDKLQLTAYEKAIRIIESGAELCMFKTKLATFGINVCYDVEFPLYALQLAHGGADVLIVPSCTDTKQGFARIHTCSRARAIENQMFVLNTCTVGASKHCDFMDINVGASGVFGPVEEAVSGDYTIARAPFDEDAMLVSDIDFSPMQHCRRRGAVRNFQDHRALVEGLKAVPMKTYTL